MIRAALAILITLALAGCSPVQLAKGVAGAAFGSGPSVSANVQAGRTNSQSTVGGTSVVEQTAPVTRADAIQQLNQNSTQSADANRVRADRVETVVVNEISPLVLFLLVLGWILPTPGQMTRSIRNGIAELNRRRPRFFGSPARD